MKFSKIIFTSLLFMSCLFLYTACNQNSGTTDKADKTGIEYTSAYICPMHCAGSGSDAAGVCPTCKMDYVANAEHPSNKRQEPGHEGHDHGSHEGHDHGSHEGHNH